ncbi:ankyrin repeat domain-containing protein [Paramyrothecium foliicola]|nr:ankyrin repeat domain-containing protein [Paramyrothecium foliicola]
MYQDDSFYFQPGSAINRIPDEVWVDVCWELSIADLAQVAKIKRLHGIATEILYKKDFLLSQDAPLIYIKDLDEDQIDDHLEDHIEGHHWGSLALTWGATYQDDALIRRSLRAGSDKVVSYRATIVRDGKWYATATPLHLAAMLGFDDIVTLLLDNGADMESLGRFRQNEPDISDQYVSTPLGVAICCRDKSTVLTLLNRGSSQEVAWVGERKDDTLHQTALTLAVRTAWEPAIDELLGSYGADVNATNALGETPLHEAACLVETTCKGDQGPRIVRKLISAGADVHAREVSGATALHYFAYYRADGIKEAIDAVVAAGAAVDAPNNRGMSPACTATIARNVEVLRCLLEDHGADPRFGEATGVDPWGLASIEYKEDDSIVAGETLECLIALQQAGAPINQAKLLQFLGVNSYHIPLHFHRLLEEPLEPEHWLPSYHTLSNKPWQNNRSILFLLRCYPPPLPGHYGEEEKRWKSVIRQLFGSAAIYNSSIAEMLARYVDPANIASRSGKNTLMRLLANEEYVDSKHQGLVSLHLSRGVDPNAKDDLGQTCLHCLAKNRVVNAASFERTLDSLIANGCSVDSQDKFGDTPLHVMLSSRALLERDVIKVEALLEAGPNLNLKNKLGDTPMATFTKVGRGLAGADGDMRRILSEALVRQRARDDAGCS